MATRHVTHGDSRIRAQQIVEQVVAEQDERLLAAHRRRRAAAEAPPRPSPAALTSDADEQARRTPGGRPGTVDDGASEAVVDDDGYLFGPPIDEPAAVAAQSPAQAAAGTERIEAGGPPGPTVGRRLRHVVGEVRDSAFADAAGEHLGRVRGYDYTRLAKAGTDRVRGYDYGRIVKAGVARARRVTPARAFDNQAVRWILVIIIGASLFGILLLLALDTMRGVLIL